MSANPLYFGITIPVHSVFGYKDKVYFSGGGNGAKNQIICYKRGMPANKLKEIINTQDIGSDIIEKMSFNRKNEIIAACSNNGSALFYKLDSLNGKLTLLAKIQADFSASPFINDIRLNDDCTLAATGGDDAILRIWDVKFDAEKSTLKVAKKSELVSHTEKINSVDFHLVLPLVVSGSNDGSVRVFNLETKQLIKTITLGNPAETKFAGVFFSFDEKYIYTIQNQPKGNAIFSKWNVEGGESGVSPIGSIKLGCNQITGSCFSKEGLFIGVGGSDGTLQIVNLRHMSLEATQQRLTEPVKGIDFTGDSRFLVGGTEQLKYDILQNLRPEGFMSKFFKVVILGLFLAYFIAALKQVIFD